jgi:hypothetical protein
VAGEPGVETCNGLDDDCDGAIDEELPGAGDPCRAGVGRCAQEGWLICGIRCTDPVLNPT